MLVRLACVASVSVLFRSKGRPKNASRFISRAAKTENLVPRSFFAPKQHGNACYAGYGPAGVELTTSRVTSRCGSTNWATGARCRRRCSCLRSLIFTVEHTRTKQDLEITLKILLTFKACRSQRKIICPLQQILWDVRLLCQWRTVSVLAGGKDSFCWKHRTPWPSDLTRFFHAFLSPGDRVRTHEEGITVRRCDYFPGSPVCG